MPWLLVLTVADGLKVAPGPPPAGPAKVTDTPLKGFPLPSSTTAVSGAGKAVPAEALCPLPPVVAMDPGLAVLPPCVTVTVAPMAAMWATRAVGALLAVKLKPTTPLVTPVTVSHVWSLDGPFKGALEGTAASNESEPALKGSVMFAGPMNP